MEKSPTMVAGSFNASSFILEKCYHKTTNRPQDEPCKFCGEIFLSWKKLTGHLAKHMEYIALPVLKLVTKMQVDDSSKVSSGEQVQSRIVPHTTSPIIHNFERKDGMIEARPEFYRFRDGDPIGKEQLPLVRPNLDLSNPLDELLAANLLGSLGLVLSEEPVSYLSYEKHFHSSRRQARPHFFYETLELLSSTLELEDSQDFKTSILNSTVISKISDTKSARSCNSFAHIAIASSNIDPCKSIHDWVYGNFPLIQVDPLGTHAHFSTSLEIFWDIQSFLSQQYEIMPDSIGKVITISGTAVHAQASTCSDYVHSHWPSYGPMVIDAVQAALDLANDEVLSRTYIIPFSC